jgi:Tol biopolymer transport system component
MQSQNFGLSVSRTLKKKESLIIIILFSWTYSLLAGCNFSGSNTPTDDAVTLIASVGSPPADSIVWSPIENRILVTAGDVGMGRAQVYILDINTEQKNVLVDVDYGDIVESTWSPDGKYVLLGARQDSIGNGAGGLWKLDIENNSLEYLVDSASPAWASDGKSIASFFVKDHNSASKKMSLRLIDVDTKNVTSIYETTDMKYFFGLSWSSDGEHLVFALGMEEPGNLYTINVMTREVSQITDTTKSTGPVWSPTGNVIAYTNWPSQGTKTTLHLISADGKCDIQIPNLEYVWSPTWSPDGKKLGYIGEDGIYFVNLDKDLGRNIYEGLCE